MNRSFRDLSLAILIVSTTAAVGLAACGSSDSDGSTTGTGGATSTGGAKNGDGNSASEGGSSCSCDITYNGVMKSLPCGQSGCVNGGSFACAAGAHLEHLGACPAGTEGSPQSGGGADGTGGKQSSAGAAGSSGGSGCELFMCASTMAGDCGGIAPCLKGNSGGAYCYEQEGEPSECSSGTTAISFSGIPDGMTRTICVPSGCPTPTTYVP